VGWECPEDQPNTKGKAKAVKHYSLSHANTYPLIYDIVSAKLACIK
jgi:hypothetical protein